MGIDTLFLAADPDLIYAGILGLLFIILVVFCVLARKTWNWVDITFTILSYLAGIAAIWGLTQVYSLRTKDMAEVQRHTEDFERYTKQADELIYGRPDSITYTDGSLRAVTGELTRELAGRGRVWGSSETPAADGNNRLFQFVAPRPNFAERSLQDVVLFAFLDRQVDRIDYPALYIGSVRVESETADSVTLAPVALAEPVEFGQPSGKWTLFEKMPLDRRGSFKEAAIALLKDKPNNSPEITALLENLDKVKKGEADLDISLFRELLTTNYLPANMIGLDPDSREYEQLIDMYAFDEVPLGKIQQWIDQNSAGRKTLQFEPPPEEVFFLYKFKAKSKPYPVDANGSVETDGLFTPLGLAVDEALHAGGEIEFKEGDTILVDQRTADGYQRGDNTIPPFKDTESVELEDRIYIRQVRDFPYEFADLRQQTVKMAEETAIVVRNNAIQTKSLEDGKTQQAARDALIVNLEFDQAALKKDLETIESLHGGRTDEVASLKQKIATLEVRIRDAYTQLRGRSIDRARRAFAGN